MTAVQRLAQLVIDRSWDERTEAARDELVIRFLDSWGRLLTYRQPGGRADAS